MEIDVKLVAVDKINACRDYYLMQSQAQYFYMEEEQLKAITSFEDMVKVIAFDLPMYVQK